MYLWVDELPQKMYFATIKLNLGYKHINIEVIIYAVLLQTSSECSPQYIYLHNV